MGMRAATEGTRAARRRFRSGGRSGTDADRQQPSSPSATFTIVVGAEVGRGILQLAALVEDLNPLLRLFELRVAEAGQADAALVQLQRRLERKVALLELLDDCLELGDRRLAILAGGIHISRQLAARSQRATEDPSLAALLLLPAAGCRPPAAVHGAVQFAALELHVNLLAVLHRAGLANDCGAIRIPAHGVAAAKNRQRTEALETRCRAAQSRISIVNAPSRGRSKAAVGLDQSRPYRAETAPDVEGLELQPERLVDALARGDAGAQRPPQLV